MHTDTRRDVGDGVLAVVAFVAGLVGLPNFFAAAEDGNLAGLVVPFALLWSAGWFRYGLFRGAEIAVVTVATLFAVVAAVVHLAPGESPVAYLVRTVVLLAVPVLSCCLAVSARWATTAG